MGKILLVCRLAARDLWHRPGQALLLLLAITAATADRLISMRDGAFIDETRLTGGTAGNLGSLAGLEG